MALLEVGRVCRITSGRNAGEYCVIVGESGKTGYGVKGLNLGKTTVGASHLEPTPRVLEIKKGASSNTILKELENAGLKTSI